VNVNTPQSIDTWKRVWDSKNVFQFDPTTSFQPCVEEGCTEVPKLIRVNNIIIEEII
jgi:hypothetical protein